MLVIEYDPVQGTSTPDGLCKELVEDLIHCNTEESNNEFRTSSSLIIDYIRLAVADSKLSKDSVIIRYKDELLYISSHGRLNKWPNGFCDYHMEILDYLLGYQLHGGEEQ